MGTFFLIFALAAFVVLGYWLSLPFGLLGILVYSAQVIAVIITVIVKAWGRLTRRLDRIERALGIAEPPEENERDGDPAPDDRNVGRDDPGAPPLSKNNQ